MLASSDSGQPTLARKAAVTGTAGDDADVGLALARRWSPVLMLPAEHVPLPVVSDLIERSDAPSETRNLSRAYGALRMALSAPVDLALSQGRDLVSTLQALDCPRALMLAEAALALSLVRGAGGAVEAAALLSRHDAPGLPERLPAERLWSVSVLAHAQLLLGQFDASMSTALAAESVGRSTGDALLHSQGYRTLGAVLLSLGNFDDGLTVMQRERALLERLGIPTPGALRYNIALAGLLAGRVGMALETLTSADSHDLEAPAPFQASVMCLKACAQALNGDVEAARRQAQALTPMPPTTDRTIDANRVWLLARTEVILGQPAAAAVRVREFLQSCVQNGEVPTAMNATQLYGVLSDACEGLGDSQGALEALKRSRDHCQVWVAQSVRSRLMVLLVSDDAKVPTLSRRLHALDDAVAQGRSHTYATAAGHESPRTVSPPMANTELRQSRVWLAEAAHELRNPLHGVLGFTSLLALSSLDQRQRDLLAGAQSSAHLLLQLCNQLLDLSSLDAGQFQLKPEWSDVAALARQVTAVLAPVADARDGLALVCDIGSAVPDRLFIDGLRLQQILLNLVGNAVKFTPSGEVRMTVSWRPNALEPDTHELRFVVSDTGPGFDPALTEQLFEEFVQLPGDLRSRGTGLGLPLSRRLAERMDGRLTAEGRPGQGSRFTLVVPIAASGIQKASAEAA